MLYKVISALVALVCEIHRDEVGAIKIKSAVEIAKKWGEVTPGRSSYYLEAASVAGADWEAAAGAAAASYKAAVSATNIQALFSGGVKRAGAEKYNRKITAVGGARFGPGVTAAISDYESGMVPMVDEISRITLSPRQPRGSEANYVRVREVGMALHKKRLILRSAGV